MNIEKIKEQANHWFNAYNIKLPEGCEVVDFSTTADKEGYYAVDSDGTFFEVDVELDIKHPIVRKEKPVCTHPKSSWVIKSDVFCDYVIMCKECKSIRNVIEVGRWRDV
jgi:hypothetical protein